MKIVIVIDNESPDTIQHTMKIIEKRLGHNNWMYRGQDYQMGMLDDDCRLKEKAAQ